jgi:hypothetical protein
MGGQKLAQDVQYWAVKMDRIPSKPTESKNEQKNDSHTRCRLA